MNCSKFEVNRGKLRLSAANLTTSQGFTPSRPFLSCRQGFLIIRCRVHVLPASLPWRGDTLAAFKYRFMNIQAEHYICARDCYALFYHVQILLGTTSIDSYEAMVNAPLESYTSSEKTCSNNLSLVQSFTTSAKACLASMMSGSADTLFASVPFVRIQRLQTPSHNCLTVLLYSYFCGITRYVP